jgi:cytochrome c-type biogenesis protein CcmE
MDPTRKRKVRFVVALSAALLLATALAYTSFAGASAAMEPSRLLTSAGVVKRGTWERDGVRHRFELKDRKGGASIPVVYEGVLPDPFREGREIMVDVEKRGSTFVGVKDSLITKCPSKFEAEPKRT